MNIKLKLYAQLGTYLPQNANANEAEISCAAGTSVKEVLDHYNVPPEMCHLVLVNGSFVAPTMRESHQLEENDHLAVWPPVAGG